MIAVPRSDCRSIIVIYRSALTFSVTGLEDLGRRGRSVRNQIVKFCRCVLYEVVRSVHIYHHLLCVSRVVLARGYRLLNNSFL